LEHRMDRSDWLAIIGCARDLAAMLGVPLKLPAAHAQKGKMPGKGQLVDIKVEAPDLVRRFNTRVFRGLKVGESPKWLKERLETYGMHAINNIVDVTNYVMIEYGQPMHAQDLKKFDKQEIVLRRARTDEGITTLDGTFIKLDEDTLVLAENSNLIGIGAIVGTQKTAVDQTTTDIVLDAGNYDQANIRRTARQLKIYNETVLRTDKFLHPQLTQVAIERATKLILDLAGGEYYENVDYYPNPPQPKQMELRTNRISQISGMDFEQEAVRRILTSLGYKIVEEGDVGWQLEVPYFRTDVDVEDDVVSDILRISNYANIPHTPIQGAPPKEITSKIYAFEEGLRDILVALGLHEHITDPLVQHGAEAKNQIVLENAPTAEKDALRVSVTETLMRVVASYRKHGIKEASVFELGNTYARDGAKYTETRVLEIIHAGSGSAVENTAQLKSIVAGIFAELGLANVAYKKDGNSAKMYVRDVYLGTLKPASVTLHTEALLSVAQRTARVVYQLQNRIAEDLSLLLDMKQVGGEIFDFVKHQPLVWKVEITQEYTDAKLGDNKKSITLKVAFDTQDQPKVNEVRSRIIAALEKDFGVKVRA